MKIDESALKRKIMYLSIETNEKVFLWLTFLGLKPVSEITLGRSKRISGKRIFPTDKHTDMAKKRLKLWLKEAGLRYVNGISRNNIFYGRDINEVKEARKVIHLFDYINEVKSGLLFGYPKKSVEDYAYNRNLELGDKPREMYYPGNFWSHNEMNSLDCSPYFHFAISKDGLKEAVNLATVWENTVRKEIPGIAQKFEGLYAKKLARDKRLFRKTVKEDTLFAQDPHEIYKNLETDFNTKEKIFAKAVNMFWKLKITEFQMASISKFIYDQVKNTKSEKDFINKLKIGMDVYKLYKRINIEKSKQRRKRLYDLYALSN